MNKYKSGEIITGYVTGIEKYGIFVNIDDQYSGLIHISEITSSFVRNIYDYVKVGEVIRVKVIDEESKRRQLKLSIKNIDYRIEKKKNQKIEETELGFSTLKIMLNKWIEEKKTNLPDKKLKK